MNTVCLVGVKVLPFNNFPPNYMKNMRKLENPQEEEGLHYRHVATKNIKVKRMDGFEWVEFNVVDGWMDGWMCVLQR